MSKKFWERDRFWVAVMAAIVVTYGVSLITWAMVTTDRDIARELKARADQEAALFQFEGSLPDDLAMLEGKTLVDHKFPPPYFGRPVIEKISPLAGKSYSVRQETRPELGKVFVVTGTFFCEEEEFMYETTSPGYAKLVKVNWRIECEPELIFQ